MFGRLSSEIDHWLLLDHLPLLLVVELLLHLHKLPVQSVDLILVVRDLC